MKRATHTGRYRIVLSRAVPSSVGLGQRDTSRGGAAHVETPCLFDVRHLVRLCTNGVYAAIIHQPTHLRVRSRDGVVIVTHCADQSEPGRGHDSRGDGASRPAASRAGERGVSERPRWIHKLLVVQRRT